MPNGSSLYHLIERVRLYLGSTEKSDLIKQRPPLQKSVSSLPLLHRNQVSPIYHEPYIITGYRKPGTSPLGSIKYAFIPHNDVGNFWTHFIPFLIWVFWLTWLAMYRIDFTDSYYYPILCFWAGSCSYAFFSSMAHLFSNISFTVRSVCFITDYLGIALYAFGGSIAGFFYEQSTDSPLYKYQNIIFAIEVVLAISATLFCGLSRFYWAKYRFLIRAVSFVLPYFGAVTPFIQRFFVCVNTGNECIMETMYMHLSGFILTFTLAFFFVSKIPEKFAPGKFDLYFQSHQLFHVTAAIQTCIQMYMLPYDAVLRREDLKGIVSPSFYNTFLLYLVAELGGLLVVAVMGLCIVKGILITNKTYSKQN